MVCCISYSCMVATSSRHLFNVSNEIEVCDQFKYGLTKTKLCCSIKFKYTIDIIDRYYVKKTCTGLEIMKD